jgi:hypothetical protein
MERIYDKLAWSRSDSPMGYSAELEWQKISTFGPHFGHDVRISDFKGTLGASWIWVSVAMIGLISTSSLWI